MMRVSWDQKEQRENVIISKNEINGFKLTI